MSAFTIYQTPKGYYWNFKASNYETLCHSEMYTSRQACLNGITSAKLNAPFPTRYGVFQGNNYQWYWHLRAANNETLCHSEGYTTQANAIHGANRFRELAPFAPIKEGTPA